jgi:hypothetical protein
VRHRFNRGSHVSYRFIRGTDDGHFGATPVVKQIARIAFLKTHARVVDVQEVRGPVYYVTLHAGSDDLRKLIEEAAECLPNGVTVRFINLAKEDKFEVLI